MILHWVSLRGDPALGFIVGDPALGFTGPSLQREVLFHCGVILHWVSLWVILHWFHWSQFAAGSSVSLWGDPALGFIVGDPALGFTGPSLQREFLFHCGVILHWGSLVPVCSGKFCFIVG